MFRVGIGFDVHRFTTGRPLVIGGVVIPFDKGLLGHSDADVLLHAISDAVLGSVALGDIGAHFPDTDERFRGAASLFLLREVYNLLKREGFRVVNVDSVIIAQKPKFAPFIRKMRENIASVLDVSVGRVSVKATTTERLGFTGREEGIAAQAVVMVQEVKSGF